MRPVASPQYPVRVGRNKQSRERRHVGKIRRLFGCAIGCGDFHIGATQFQEDHQVIETRLIGAERRPGSTEMAEHHGERKRCDIILQRRDNGQAGVELNMPIPTSKLFCDDVESSFCRDMIGIFHRFKIEPHPPHADLCHVIKFSSSYRFAEDDNASCACAELTDCVDCAGIVDPINAWRDNDDPIEAERRLQVP